MDNINFPALFQSADEASNKAQQRYLLLIRSEYLVLFVAAALSMPWSTEPIYYAAYALIFVISIVLLLVRKLMKLEQGWYRTRALAESIKTSSWRYMMKTPPFDGQQADARREFVDLLRDLLSSNREAGRALASTVTTGEQVTDVMESHRSQALAARKATYISGRIDDQCGWYARKAIFNRNASITWITLCIGVYIAAGGIVLSRIAFPDWTIWPISPLIVCASSIIGWMQIKKFGELSSAYALTAQEIGLIKAKVGEEMDESEFSEFVNEAELAFSREHTQWIARQHM
ncbi:MAG: DUF4231 domain-containing protein [Brevundimonas sp.]